MNQRPPVRRWVARSLPGVLLVATMFDDPVLGGGIVAARVAYGTIGLVVASVAFTLLSIVVAAATAWAVHREPLQLSPRNQDRVSALLRRRAGRFLIPHPERPITTAIAAAIFGSVAPMIVAALHPERPTTYPIRMAFVCGIAYGVAFSADYGLLGALIDAAL